MKKTTNSIFLNSDGKLNINPNLFVNSFLGIFLALLFDDLKKSVLDNLLLKIIKDNIKTKKIYIGNVEYDTENIINAIFHLIIIIIFLTIIYFV
jgi:hypothetical protein